MQKILSAVLVLFLLVGCSPLSPEPHRLRAVSPEDLPTREPFTGTTNPIIKIRSYDWVTESGMQYSSGTGFVIERNKHTYLVTAFHVVDSSLILEFLTYDNKHLDIKFGRMAVIPHLDVAIFEINKCSATIKPLTMGPYKQGGSIRATGYPAGETYKEYEGISHSSPIHSTATVESGMSGGPVFDTENRVIGVVSAMIQGGVDVKSVFSRLEDAFARYDHK